MTIEFRILSGALAGQVKRFDQSIVVVGRQAGVDLRFDPQQDLDVSGRHAELRGGNDGYILTDTGSTNGTFVNDKQVTGSRPLVSGDKVRFGAKGPEAEVAFTFERADHLPTPVRTTEQRIAIAVSKQTAGLKRAMIAGILLLVIGGGTGAWYWRHQAAQNVEQFQRLLLQNDSMRVELQGRLGQFGDTALINELQRDLAELQERLTSANTDAEREAIRGEIQALQGRTRRMVQMDVPTIFKQNAPGVAVVITQIAGRNYAGSGFSINKEGLLVTNRHNVRDTAGRAPTQIAVKFTDTRVWRRARVVKVSSDPDEDLALVQVTDDEGPYPFVRGISTGASDASEGMSAVTIGYPLGFETPMEGEGNDLMAKATLNPGTVSKRTSTVLQIDSYAAHGSSGSPVFSTRGLVIGVIYGGHAQAGGKIVYAVPPERLAAFIPAEHKAVVKD